MPFVPAPPQDVSSLPLLLHPQGHCLGSAFILSAWMAASASYLPLLLQASSQPHPPSNHSPNAARTIGLWENLLHHFFPALNPPGAPLDCQTQPNYLSLAFQSGFPGLACLSSCNSLQPPFTSLYPWHRLAWLPWMPLILHHSPTLSHPLNLSLRVPFVQ